MDTRHGDSRRLGTSFSFVPAVARPSPHVSAIGMALDASGLDTEAARRAGAGIEDRLGLPCHDPIAMGVDRIVDRMLQWADTSATA